jgi:pilus assembly protein Flp/PilA
MGMQKIFKRCLDDESGVTAIEYALIASLIALVVVALGPVVGNALNATFTTVANALQ